MSPEEPVGRAVTVITGAGRGIGAATAGLLARRGHDLVLGHLTDRASVESVAAAARAAGAAVVVVAGDVRDPAVADRLFDAASDLGPVTGLVNNAGVTAHVGDLADTPVDVISHVVETKLFGAIWCARRAAQVMSTCRGQGGPGGLDHRTLQGAGSGGREGERRRPRRRRHRHPRSRR